MFELNNLSIYVGSPVPRWLQHLEALPAAEQAEPFAAAGAWGRGSLLARAPGDRGLRTLTFLGASADLAICMRWAPAALPPAGRFIDALPEELPGCDGNAFYALHRCGTLGPCVRCCRAPLPLHVLPSIQAAPRSLCTCIRLAAPRSCCNHSCAPNAEAFKRDEDDDGSGERSLKHSFCF